MKTIIGKVVSDKMVETVSVEVNQWKEDNILSKRYRRSKKFLADNPGNLAKMGDRVEIREIRPMSKRKSWRVISVRG